MKNEIGVDWDYDDYDYMWLYSHEEFDDAIYELTGITARMLNNCSVTQLGSCRGPVLEKSVGWTWKDQWR